VSALVAAATQETDMMKAYGTMPEAVEYSGLSRSRLYEALKAGELSAKKAGRRTLIPFAELESFLANLPTYRAGA